MGNIIVLKFLSRADTHFRIKYIVSFIIVLFI